MHLQHHDHVGLTHRMAPPGMLTGGLSCCISASTGRITWGHITRH